ncbi:hypothetical protein [Actinomadura violacea]|uniref:Uncharacterized protein n=1 Tax=Actinomadura violacea TaxID=2819934 RepID=A0ABS3RKC7_9ACTN|nr:hypothetical protein [Actinomadura violacea]MBO2456549.1 hypothetical protein [Actinomadura violacea]
MTRVGRFTLAKDGGLWFLLNWDKQIVGTLVPQPDGTWRCRVPDGGVTTVTVPGDVAEDDRPEYVARQVVMPSAQRRP